MNMSKIQADVRVIIGRGRNSSYLRFDEHVKNSKADVAEMVNVAQADCVWYQCLGPRMMFAAFGVVKL